MMCLIVTARIHPSSASTGTEADRWGKANPAPPLALFGAARHQGRGRPRTRGAEAGLLFTNKSNSFGATLVGHDPRGQYVDVAVGRGQAFPGGEAGLEAGGRTFTAVAAERLEERGTETD